MKTGRHSPASTLAILVGTMMFAGPQLAAHAQQSAAAPFHAYDNTHYQDVDLVGEAGLVKANILYQRQEWIACTAEDKLPPKADFQAAVQAAAVHRGPVVLDFENIWIKNVDAAQAHRRYRLWRQLFLWAKEAVPDRMIGAYDLLGPNTDQYLDCARDLSQYQDGFFPHLYTASGLTQATWERRLDNRVVSARNVNPSKPLIPYIRPQEEATCGGDPEPTYLPADRWRRQLDQLGAKASGFIVWSPVMCSQRVGDNRGWIIETVDFMRSLPSASSTVAQTRSWPLAPPLTACAPTPGVSVPVSAPKSRAVSAPTTVQSAAVQCEALPAL
ncbi:hypothetical protein GLA29479_808 [Lysobacter antibioticus]|uniref:hypothetical protein n=1 Tax=Lysobacter antibioticus TaxID=84531 RepID=UPI00071FAA4E|nr:hypothetical protein [Lysobacter antibioticus]ALN61692.1 hypothetical protein GLA29479_808 [Lysobacter antibioticus]